MVKLMMVLIVLTGAPLSLYGQPSLLYQVETKKTAPASLRYEGTLHPSNIIEIKAPEQAILKKQHVAMGDIVKQGQLLIEWSAPELLNQYYQTKKEYFECQEAFLKLKEWNLSATLLNAKREVTQTQYAFNQANYRLEQTKKLFEAGVVSKEEYEIDKRNRFQAMKNFEQAQEALLQAKKKGDPQQVGLARMKATVAKQRYVFYKKQVADLKVFAKMDGIILPAQETEEGLFALLIDPSHWKVIVNVNERDAVALQEGQRAQIMITALDVRKLEGKIEKINIQPVDGMDSKSLPRYQVSIPILSDMDEFSKAIRLKMSASVSCHFPEVEGIFVPKQAITMDESGAYVNLALKNGEAVINRVEIGRTMENEVQVVKGLKEGDSLVLFG